MNIDIIPNVGSSLAVVSGGSETDQKMVGETADWGNVVWEHAFSGPRGTQGARPTGAVPQNRQLILPFLVIGTSKDDLATNISALHEVMDRLRRYGGQVKVKPTSQTYSVYFDAFVGTAELTEWSSPKTEVHNRAGFLLSATCAPYLLGDPFDIFDDFSSNTIANYTADAGAVGNVSITGGVMTAVANLTTQNRLLHSARGYSIGDTQETGKYTPGATITSFLAGAFFKRTASNSYLAVYVDDNGTNSRLRLDVVTAGSTTNRSSTNLVARVVDGTPFWVRGRIEGNVVYLHYFSLAGFPSGPTPMGTPTLTATYTLAGAEVTNFGSAVTGGRGLVWTPQHASATADDYRSEPYTYRNRTLPEMLPLGGSIPGDAPPLVGVATTHSGGAAAPVFALFGWVKRPSVHNYVWNGDFEDDADGWSVAAVTSPSYITGGATSIARITSQTKYGAASGQITATNAVFDSGAAFRIFKRFRAGVTYTFSVWVRSSTSTATTYLMVGANVAGHDRAFTAGTALSTPWTQKTVTWTPSADRDDAYVAVNREAPQTADVFQIDGVQIYEGTAAPTLGKHSEGQGAVPPFGIVEGAACDSGDLSSWAVTADADYQAGYGLQATTAGVGTAAAQYLIDPALIDPDDYSLGALSVEVFARVELASTVVSPTLILSARPDAGTSYGTERYSDEWGSAGKLLTLPSSGTRFRIVKLGTVGFISDPDNRVRWRLRVAASWAAGSEGQFGLDYLILCPVRSCALSPTSEPNDSTYPDFVASTSETTKTIRSDLRGQVAKPPFAAHPDHGLGGELLELPIGNADLLVKLSSLVPDDPTSDATTEQLAHSATVHAGIVPRWAFFRPS